MSASRRRRRRLWRKLKLHWPYDALGGSGPRRHSARTAAVWRRFLRHPHADRDPQRSGDGGDSSAPYVPLFRWLARQSLSDLRLLTRDLPPAPRPNPADDWDAHLGPTLRVALATRPTDEPEVCSCVLPVVYVRRVTRLWSGHHAVPPERPSRFGTRAWAHATAGGGQPVHALDWRSDSRLASDAIPFLAMDCPDMRHWLPSWPSSSDDDGELVALCEQLNLPGALVRSPGPRSDPVEAWLLLVRPDLWLRASSVDG